MMLLCDSKEGYWVMQFQWHLFIAAGGVPTAGEKTLVVSIVYAWIVLHL